MRARDPDPMDMLAQLCRVFDTVYRSDADAAAFLGVGDKFFRDHYRDYCGLKQGNNRSYLKSELLERRAQLAHELTGAAL